jgi:hypothetical protein
MLLDEAAIERGTAGSSWVVKALRVVAVAPTPQPEKGSSGDGKWRDSSSSIIVLYASLFTD